MASGRSRRVGTLVGAYRALAAATAFFALFLTGCKSPSPEQRWSGLFESMDGRTMLLEVDATTLIAFDPKTGVRRWIYRREGVEQHPVIKMRKPKLLCPPLLTSDGQMILRYEDGVHSISADGGAARWVRRCPQNCPPLCAAITPDNATVFVAGRGSLLNKIDARGETVWSFELPEKGRAVSAPQAVPGSGDILLRTRAHVLCVNPLGKLNWRRPVEGF
jgi:outer membrane protein assembly factor BamB